MLQGSFAALLRANEKEAQRIHNNIIRFLVYVEKKQGKLKRKAFTLADAAKEMEEDDISNNPTE